MQPITRTDLAKWLQSAKRFSKGKIDVSDFLNQTARTSNQTSEITYRGAIRSIDLKQKSEFDKAYDAAAEAVCSKGIEFYQKDFIPSLFSAEEAGVKFANELKSICKELFAATVAKGIIKDPAETILIANKIQEQLSKVGVKGFQF